MILCTNILPNKNWNIWDTSLPPLPIPLFILSSPRSVTSDSLKAVGLEHGLIPWTSPLHGNIFPSVLPCALPTTHKNLYSIFLQLRKLWSFYDSVKIFYTRPFSGYCKVFGLLLILCFFSPPYVIVFLCRLFGFFSLLGLTSHLYCHLRNSSNLSYFRFSYGSGDV